MTKQEIAIKIDRIFDQADKNYSQNPEKWKNVEWTWQGFTEEMRLKELELEKELSNL